MDLQTAPEKLFDLAFLEEMDDDEYLLGMLNLLVSETPKDLSLMKDAALIGNIETVGQKAHVLKSTSGIIRVNQFVAIMVKIEAAVKEEAGAAELIGLIDIATQLFAKVETGLRERMNTLQ